MTAALAALVVLAAGCNSRLIRPPATVYADGGSRAIGASVAEQEGRFSSVMSSFFPSLIALHPGDAVNFEVRDSGEPHTIALGRLVDAALTALDTLETTADLRAIEGLPQMRALPTVFPSTVPGTPRVNRSAAERCFLTRGSPPVSPTGGARACPEREQPDFDGTQVFYSGGYLQEGEPFRVKLADGVRPGIYGFMCLVHRAAMTGAIEVRPATVERPPVSEVREQAKLEEDEVASSLGTVARRVLPRTGDPVLAGAGPAGRARGLLSSFVPREASIDPGDPLTWELFGMHSISFDPERQAREGVLLEDRDGVRVNLDAWRPVDSPAQPAAALAYPPTLAVASVDGGSWDGEGRFSSGILRATSPAKVLYTLRFTKAGTYNYLCVVHQPMRGTVRVG
jgi:plastocyanin